MKKKIFTISILAALMAPALLTACKKKTTTKETTNSKVTTKQNTVTKIVYNDLTPEQIYGIAVENGYSGTYEDWIKAVKGDKVQLQVSNGYIQFKLESEDAWTNLYDLKTNKGTTGSSAYETYCKQNPDYAGTEEDWINALVLGTLKTTDNSDSRVNDGDETIGLEYELSADKTYYILKGIGKEVITNEIIVPATYNNLPVKEVAEYAFYYRNDLKKIVLPESVNKINAGAFYGCSSLEIFKFAAATIGSNAFNGCTKLSNVYFRGTVAKWFDNSFESENSNPMIYADNLYIYNEDGKLYDLDSSIVVDIPSTVTKIKKYALANMESIVGIVVPNSVTLIEDKAFVGCRSIESVSLPFTGKDGSDGVNSLFGSIFGEDSYLESVPMTQTFVDEYDVDGSVKTTDTKTYYIPTKLKNISITNQLGEDGIINYGSLSGLTTIESVYIETYAIGEKAFMGCTKLEKVNFSSNVNTIGEKAFENCLSIKELTIPGTINTISSGALYGCSGIETLELSFVGGKNIDNFDSNYTFGYIFGEDSFTGSYKATQNEVDYYIPSSIKTLIINTDKQTYIAQDSLSNLMIENIVIPSTSRIRTINTKAFENSTGIKNVTLSKINGIGVEAFKGCSNLKNVYVTTGFNAYDATNTLVEGKAISATATAKEVATALKDEYSYTYKKYVEVIL